MRRYSTTRKKIDKAGIRSYSTTYYPTIRIENNDMFIVSKDGDRLDNLAYKYYGDNTLWWIIAKANGIRGITALYAGTVLRIPGDVMKIIERFRNINKTG